MAKIEDFPDLPKKRKVVRYSEGDRVLINADHFSNKHELFRPGRQKLYEGQVISSLGSNLYWVEVIIPVRFEVGARSLNPNKE
jgi:hypothetical protein